MSELGDLLDDIVSDVDGTLLFSPSGSLYERFAEAGSPVVVATENAVGTEHHVELPLEFDDVSERVRFGVEGAIENGFAEEGEQLVCVLALFSEDADTVTRVRAGDFEQSGVYDLFVNKSRPLSYNPFEKSHVHVGDPIVDVMLKEFSRLDGAFVISDSGKIVSAYRYLEPAAEGVDIPKGLGARHMAAGAITMDTNAVAVVLSESDGLVRAFSGGEIILELDPEAY